jgi:BolA protein
MTPRMQAIEAALQAAFPDARITLIDESHKHVGHAGARDGRGHFDLTLISAAFRGQRSLVRHRLVYAALGPLMDTDIHALRLTTLTPEEAP